ncbi:MAG: acyl carrier protein [Lachnospiraceae bacterium]|nr:acyl carrier protein [Lachnospiraceae bacterium]
MRDSILEILREQRPDVDFENETQLVSGGVLESFDIVSIVAELDDEFDISIGPKDLVASNFDSVEAITEMVERLTEEE